MPSEIHSFHLLRHSLLSSAVASFSIALASSRSVVKSAEVRAPIPLPSVPSPPPGPPAIVAAMAISSSRSFMILSTCSPPSHCGTSLTSDSEISLAILRHAPADVGGRLALARLNSASTASSSATPSSTKGSSPASSSPSPDGGRSGGQGEGGGCKRESPMAPAMRKSSAATDPSHAAAAACGASAFGDASGTTDRQTSLGSKPRSPNFFGSSPAKSAISLSARSAHSR